MFLLNGLTTEFQRFYDIPPEKFCFFKYLVQNITHHSDFPDRRYLNTDKRAMRCLQKAPRRNKII